MLDILIIIPEITKGMKSLGPKSMLKIKSMTILQHQIAQLRKTYKKCNIFLSVGFEADRVRRLLSNDSDIHYIYNDKYHYTNQAKSISLLLDSYIPKNLLVISNGILFKNNPFVCDNNARVYLLDKPKYNFDIGCNQSDDLHYLFYDLPTPWTECVLFDSSSLKSLEHLKSTQNIDQLYLFEIINLLIDQYNTRFIKTTVKKSNFMKVNTIKDIPKAKIFI